MNDGLCDIRIEYVKKVSIFERIFPMSNADENNRMSVNDIVSFVSA